MEIIRKRADFLALRQGAKFSAPGFLLVRGPENRPGEPPRIGFTVTKKLGNAVRRNRIRRRLREAARKTLPLYGAPGCDYVVIARMAAFDRDFAELLDDFQRGLLRLSATPK